jgi:hypothetical protein
MKAPIGELKENLKPTSGVGPVCLNVSWWWAIFPCSWGLGFSIYVMRMVVVMMSFCLRVCFLGFEFRPGLWFLSLTTFDLRSSCVFASKEPHCYLCPVGDKRARCVRDDILVFGFR